MAIIVPGYGPRPSRVLLCGEAPGRAEAYHKPSPRPFVGKSGAEQEHLYLSGHDIPERLHVSSRGWYKTNVVKLYQEGNPDPTPELIDYWTPHLLDEIERCNPRLIIAVGRFAAKWFFGDRASILMTHGLPHRPGEFDSSRASRAPRGCVILPVEHPASGFYSGEKRASIDWDYRKVAYYSRLAEQGRPIHIPYDHLAGTEDYRDVSGSEFADYCHMLVGGSATSPIALDTEGTPDNPFCLQISAVDGEGVMLRRSRSDFNVGLDTLRRVTRNRRRTIVMHNAMYDLEMMAAMGLDLGRTEYAIADTMYGAYLLRTEPQGLKPLAWRWCRMSMASHAETIKPLGDERQLAFLSQVVSRKSDWGPVEPRVIIENDGRAKIYKPNHISAAAAKILDDYAHPEKVIARRRKRSIDDDSDDDSATTLDEDDDGEGNVTDVVNLAKRWANVDRVQRLAVERVLGKMPHGSIAALWEKDPQLAIQYACRDSDATLRLYNAMIPVLKGEAEW
jgi:uracil-DNA glycosylase family 4